MNKKSLIILVVIFVILIALVFVKKNMKPQVPTTEEITDIIASTVVLDNLSGIAIRLGDGETQDDEKPRNVGLSKDDTGQWVVGSFYDVYANENTVKSLVEKLDQLQGELRSNKKGVLGDYGIGDDNGAHVELRSQDGKNINVVVGTEKSGFRNNFVRLAGSNAVYVVNENLLADLGVRDLPEEEGGGQKLDVQKWVDKRITHLKVDDVVGMVITQSVDGTEETIMDIRKMTVDDKKKWQSVIPYAFNLNASKIKDKLDKWNSTYARDVIAPNVEGVFDAPDWTAVFTMENSDQITLVRGAKDAEEKNYYMKLEGVGYYYLVPVSTFENREKQLGDIFAGNPLDVTEDNIETLAVNDIEGKKKFRAVKKPPEETAEEGSSEEKPKEEYVWQGSDGETVERSKVQKVINKIKDMKLEVVLGPVSSPKGAVTLDVTKDGATQKYTISQDVKLDNGKECHIFKAGGDDQDYCASKSQVTALKKALP